MSDRFFFHSFPRGRAGETSDNVVQRGLKILAFMREVGLVLAPELVKWDITGLVGGANETLETLQRRICFTELSIAELPQHSITFGPIALAFTIEKLRTAGAMPVVYVPQGTQPNPLSLLAIFLVRGAHHTRHVLSHLNNIAAGADREKLQAQSGLPVNEDYTMNLRNSGPNGEIVEDYVVPAIHIHQLMKHVGFNNIPFDHSVGVLAVLLNMFYPTDNPYAQDELGYYRQREWRLVGGEVNFNGRPMGRQLTETEQTQLLQIDPAFWGRDMTVKIHADAPPDTKKRVEWAQVYEPTPGWNWLEYVDHIRIPKAFAEDARRILGDGVTIVATD
ncbi:abortive infection system antitoxin AbiGi family protein [Bradyrhizobium sp. SK17]|uniref:abortive infection system antitoxin AbiGi family protein n=1 Tax=Bradyrhizobium sp. SK17 TaxID=2057741 RepID=UPI0012FE6541|nr:abortive infection system antitoxin AbiGi family protein [Bradyrhizobium sp. SK17]